MPIAKQKLRKAAPKEVTDTLESKATIRLTSLRSELDSGKRMLAKMEQNQLELQNRLLQIAGAVQVIEELLNSNKKQKEITPSVD